MKRFGHIIVRQGVEPFYLVDGKASCGQQDHRDMRRVRIGLYALAKFHPVHLRHYHIGNYDIRLVSYGLFISFPPVFGHNYIVVHGQELAEIIPEVRAVVGDQDRVSLSGRPAVSCRCFIRYFRQSLVIGRIVAVAVVPVYFGFIEMGISGTKPQIEHRILSRDGFSIYFTSVQGHNML